MDQVVDGIAVAMDGKLGRSAERLREISDFGSDPGNLRMLAYAPIQRGGRRPLVVVLHGCTQTAAVYDAASGWSRLAERCGFAIVYPEQRRANNGQTCFSWFQPEDVARHGGEAESIRSMIGKAVMDFGVDFRRVYICGLSAGGAMACAMLAAYPEVFAGGAVIAGLPFGIAANASEALDAMYSGRILDKRVWGDRVRSASEGYTGAWPAVAIWHGQADRVVKPINAGELVKQWSDVHAVGSATPDEDRVGPATRRVWRDPRGRACVTEYAIPGLGHGAPVADADPPAPFFLPAGLSCTEQIARDFGLTGPSTAVLASGVSDQEASRVVAPA